MKWMALVVAALCVAPSLARAGGLIDLNPAETKLRNAQKALKKDVDKQTDKHHVTVGGDAKKPAPKKAPKAHARKK